MTQIGEAIAAFFSSEKKEKVKKRPIKIRFSLFFDGTLNNRTNIEEREKNEVRVASATYKKQGDGGANSYDNGRTNIALMEPHAPLKVDKKGETGYDYVFKIYIEGQGTFNKEGDSGLGYSMGAGDSGVASRARQGINQALQLIGKYLEKKSPEEYLIEKVDVDVFGFSRGAATARHCIYLVSEQSWDVTVPLFARLRFLGYEETAEKNIEVKFAGVYDTVVSVNASQYNWWADNKLNQRAIAFATKSVHLAAAEEHRQDFPLHTIKSAKDSGKGKEYYLPGVHSDVGGSYNLANERLFQEGKNSTIEVTIASGSYKKMVAQQEKLIGQGAFTKENLKVNVTERGARRKSGSLASEIVPLEGQLVELRTINGPEEMRVSSEVNRIINQGYVSDLVIDMNRLVTQGWYSKKNKEIEINVTTFDEMGSAIGNLVVNRKNIKSAYSNIPLKIMATFARENGIKLDPKLEDKADTILTKQPDLVKLEGRLKKYVGSVGNNSKPEDWIEDLSINNIRHGHLHMSSKCGIGYSPRMRNNRRVRYYYEG